MNFLEDLEKRLEEEKAAVLKYQELASQAPDEVSRRFMLRISREEERHADFLSWIIENIEEELAPLDAVEKQNQRLRPKSRVNNKRLNR